MPPRAHHPGPHHAGPRPGPGHGPRPVRVNLAPVGIHHRQHVRHQHGPPSMEPDQFSFVACARPLYFCIRSLRSAPAPPTRPSLITQPPSPPVMPFKLPPGYLARKWHALPLPSLRIPPAAPRHRLVLPRPSDLLPALLHLFGADLPRLHSWRYVRSQPLSNSFAFWMN